MPSWEWRIWQPFTADGAHCICDLAGEMGSDVDVDQLDEVHFVCGPQIDLRYVFRHEVRQLHVVLWGVFLWEDASCSCGMYVSILRASASDPGSQHVWVEIWGTVSRQTLSLGDDIFQEGRAGRLRM